MIPRGEVVEVAIEQLLFAKNAPLKNEFLELFESLFDNASIYQDIVRFLATRRSGFTRSEILAKGLTSDGGGLTKILNNLCYSNFIDQYMPLASKENRYRLCDLFSLFHLKWLDTPSPKRWQTIIASNSYNSWLGYAFEIVAWNHEEQLAQELGVKRIGWQAIP